MRYMRVEDLARGSLGLYEVDDDGSTHRHVHVRPSRSRFAPEDMIMLTLADMSRSDVFAGCDEIERDEFEKLWGEVLDGRPFLDCLPDPRLSWVGIMETPRETHTCYTRLYWAPTGTRPPGFAWMNVPGFDRLYVATRYDRAARAVARAIFLERPIKWKEPTHV